MTNTIETFTKHLKTLGWAEAEYSDDDEYDFEHRNGGGLLYSAYLLPPGHRAYDYSDGRGDERFTNELDEPVFFMSGHGVTYVFTQDRATPEAITQADKALLDAQDESFVSTSNYYDAVKELLDKGDYTGALEFGRRHYEDYNDDYGILAEMIGLYNEDEGETPPQAFWNLLEEAKKNREAA
jgi:hypothetical protein